MSSDALSPAMRQGDMDALVKQLTWNLADDFHECILEFRDTAKDATADVPFEIGEQPEVRRC